MTTVAKRYGVSSNYLARVCEQLKIPRPPRGYWQQLAAGQKLGKEPLPEQDPGDETAWHRGRDGYYGNPPPLPVFTGLGARRRRRGERPKTHPLLVGAREDFLDSRERRYDDDGYLKPKKSTLPYVFASKDGLGSALDFANRLYLALEDEGHWVREAAEFRYSTPTVEHREGSGHREQYGSRPWSPARPTLVFIGGVAIGLAIFEIAENAEVIREDDKWVRVLENRATERLREQASWRFHHRFIPSGRLGLIAYSPYNRGSWVQRWEDPRTGELKKLICDIVGILEAAAPTIATLTTEAHRKAEEEHQAYLAQQREERLKQLAELRQKAAQESREDLLGVVNSWVTACDIEGFFANLTKNLELGDVERAQIEERIQTARSLFGGTDAAQHFRRWRTPEHFFEKAKKGLYWDADDV